MIKKQSLYSENNGEIDYSNLINKYPEEAKAPDIPLQDRYSALLHTVKDWIWEVDANALISYAGPQVVEILGYHPEELIGTSPFDLMDEKEGKRVKDIFTAIARNQRSFHGLENVCLHKDGSKRIIETSAIPIFESDGTFRGYAGTDRDITERRIAERKLIETQQKLENLISNLPGMAYRYTNDENTTLLFASFGCKALLGYEPHHLTDLRQVSFETLIHPDDRKRIRSEINNATAQGRPYHLIYRLVTAGSNVKWVSDKGREIPSSNNNPGTLEGFIVDNTDRLQALRSIQPHTIHDSKEIERQLELSESLKNVMSVINSCRFVRETLAYITEESVNLLDADSAICLYQRGNANDIELVTTVNFPSPWTLKNHDMMQWISSNAGQTRVPLVVDLENDHHNKDQATNDQRNNINRQYFESLYSSCLIVPVFAGASPGGAMVLFYKSEKRYTPEELELASLLGREIDLAIESGRLRTLATDAAIVEERKRLARELHDSVTQLLCGLTLYSESARRFLNLEDNDGLAECIKQISISTRQALSEMRLLVYELHPETTDMGDMLEVLTRRLQAVEARSGIKTSLDFQARSDLPDIIRATLIKVSQEALNNIIKHAKADRVNIRIDQTGQQITMSIRDNGCGFDLNNAMRYSGIGLKSMEEQMRMIGGELIIESAIGEGTCLKAIVHFE
ncbi:MAG: PAS domain S-box protein [Anaerolineales bacterium]|nr:PAS domain S-box protein [Anaerolineales bacterium]